MIGVNSGMVQQSFATGLISGSTGNSGGLVGYSQGTITDCYARSTINVIGGGYAGGLVGHNEGTVNTSYAAGAVSAERSGYANGLIGRRNGTVNNGYYCSETTGCSDTGEGTPLTRAEMSSEISLNGFDFTNVWGLFSTVNGGFPFFIWEMKPAANSEQAFWYDVKESKSYPYEYDGAMIGGLSYVIPVTHLSNVVKLHEQLFGQTDYTPTDTVKVINEEIKNQSGKYGDEQADYTLLQQYRIMFPAPDGSY